MPLHLLSVLHVSIGADDTSNLRCRQSRRTSLRASAEVSKGCLFVELVARRHFSRKVSLENELRLCLQTHIIIPERDIPAHISPKVLEQIQFLLQPVLPSPSSECILAESSFCARHTQNPEDKELFEMTCLPSPLYKWGN